VYREHIFVAPLPGPHLLVPFHQLTVKVQQFHASATASYLFIAATPNLFPGAARTLWSPWCRPLWSKQRWELPCFIAVAPLISPTLPPTIVFPIQSMMSLRVPSRSHRSAINTALGAISTQGGGLDGARTSTGGAHVPLDRSTDALYQESSVNMARFRYNWFFFNVMWIDDVIIVIGEVILGGMIWYEVIAYQCGVSLPIKFGWELIFLSGVRYIRLLELFLASLLGCGGSAVFGHGLVS
jgi:hypothetical protein